MKEAAEWGEKQSMAKRQDGLWRLALGRAAKRMRAALLGRHTTGPTVVVPCQTGQTELRCFPQLRLPLLRAAAFLAALRARRCCFD